jgi:predicted ABC-type ATPase
MKELIIIAGANGSGKTTFSADILERTGYDFLNADEIERELAVSKLQAGNRQTSWKSFSVVWKALFQQTKILFWKVHFQAIIW